MPKRTSKRGSEVFIVDDRNAHRKVLRYLHDGCERSCAIDDATGSFEIRALLVLQDSARFKQESKPSNPWLIRWPRVEAPRKRTSAASSTAW
jgi:hypothetical protein